MIIVVLLHDTAHASPMLSVIWYRAPGIAEFMAPTSFSGSLAVGIPASMWMADERDACKINPNRIP
jgi:hypothetical protein